MDTAAVTLPFSALDTPAGELPLAVWPCAQTSAQYQRAGRYLPASTAHPAKMLPELARRIIAEYAPPGGLVVDPMLGYGGHCLTKSRHYSTTMGALRAARRAFATRRHHGPTVPLDRDGRLLPPAGTIAVAGWQYAGRGYTTRPTPGSPPAWPPITNKHAASPARS